MAVRLVTDASRYPLDYLPPQIVDHLDVVQVVRPCVSVHAKQHTRMRACVSVHPATTCLPCVHATGTRAVPLPPAHPRGRDRAHVGQGESLSFSVYLSPLLGCVLDARYITCLCRSLSSSNARHTLLLTTNITQNPASNTLHHHHQHQLQSTLVHRPQRHPIVAAFDHLLLPHVVGALAADEGTLCR